MDKWFKELDLLSGYMGYLVDTFEARRLYYDPISVWERFGVVLIGYKAQKKVTFEEYKMFNMISEEKVIG